jgi:hypothetical protein
MKTSTALALFCLVGFLAPALPLAAQDNVTIPKSRLQELEQKERELNQLKGSLTTTNDSNAVVHSDWLHSAQKPPAALPEAAVAHVSPPIASLPPLKEGEEVDAMDLANHYRADQATADARYLKRKFLLRGEIAGFEKPIFKRDYNILLKTSDRDTRVICRFYPPERFNAVFPANHGSQLIGTMGETRIPLAKVGETVVLNAECKGCKDSCVIISGGDLRAVPATK